MMTIQESLQILKEEKIETVNPYYCMMKDGGGFAFLAYGKIDDPQEEEYYWSDFQSASLFLDPDDIKIGLKSVSGGVWGKIYIAQRRGNEMVDTATGETIYELTKWDLRKFGEHI